MSGQRARQVKLAHVPAKEWGYLAGLKAGIEIKGENLSEALLAGLSGDCFRFYFSPLVLLEGTFVFPENPLRAACARLGFEYRYSYNIPLHQSLEEVKTALHDGMVPIVSFWSTMPEPPSDWDLVVGYDEDVPALLVKSCEGDVRAYGVREFTRRWMDESMTLEGPLEGPPYASKPFFILCGRRDRPADSRALILNAFARAAKILRTESLTYDGRRFHCGFAAYQALADELDAQLPADYAALPPDRLEELLGTYRARRREYDCASREVDRQKALEELSRVELFRHGEWNCFPLGLLARSRSTAFSFLSEAARCFKGHENLVVSDAAAHYHVACDLLGKLRWVHPANTESWCPREDRLDSDDGALRARAIKNLASELKKSASLVREILFQEQRAIELLESVAGASMLA